jgi:UDP-N-acetylmuramyl tripeptide synthase
MLQQLVSASTDWVVLNANDERVSQLTTEKDVRTYWYAHSEALQSDFLTDDQLYHDESSSYYLAAPPVVELTEYAESQVTVVVDGKPANYHYSLQGGHNAINLTAALTVLFAILPSYSRHAVDTALADLHPAFGRGEIITLPSGGKLTLQLVKNPGGFTQALRMVKAANYDIVGIAINDDYPDGRDVSWLWDVDFHELHSTKQVLCGGTRAADIANRLKYDDIKVDAVLDEIANFSQLLDQTILASTEGAIVFCTYTAMLKLRGIYLGTHSGLDEAEL